MSVSRRKLVIGVGLGAVTVVAALASPYGRRALHVVAVRMRGRRTVEERVAEFAAARERVRVATERAGVGFPPARVLLLGLKDERRLDVYGGVDDRSQRLIASYPILAASGTLGPKLREGDRQVPEGVYALESLNPNSRFHAALRVGYPNDFDRAMAARDGRTRLGGDIMIHGGSASIGCLAMGDPAAEDLFVLAAAAGIANVTIVLSPVDLRARPLPPDLATRWRTALYDSIRAELAALPLR